MEKGITEVILWIFYYSKFTSILNNVDVLHHHGAKIKFRSIA